MKKIFAILTRKKKRPFLFSLPSLAFLARLLIIVITVSCTTISIAANYTTFITTIQPNVDVYTLADNQDVVGQVLRIPMLREDTLTGMAEKYDVAVTELYAANPGINPHKIKIGTLINIPKMYVLPPQNLRDGIVINVPGLRVYYFDKAKHQVMTFPVALGREGWRTPLASTTVIRKLKNPTWYAPKSIRNYMKKAHNKDLPAMIKAGPDNPLGNYAISLGLKGYFIHGTDSQESVGRFVSSGCIRMYAPDVEKLFNAVKVGTPVSIIHTPYKVGLLGHAIYLEVHRPVTHKDGLYEKYTTSVEDALRERVGTNATVDSAKIAKMMKAKTGIPEVIGYVK